MSPQGVLGPSNPPAGGVVGAGRPAASWRRYVGDLALAGENLAAQKVRTALTALGMIFGVGAVIGMLAIGAGARQQSLEMIARMGLHNLLVNSIPATSQAQLQRRRRLSHGLDDSDLRVLQADVPSVRWISPRREMRPQGLLPAPSGPLPEVLGVVPAYARIHGLRLLFRKNPTYSQLGNTSVKGYENRTTRSSPALFYSVERFLRPPGRR